MQITQGEGGVRAIGDRLFRRVLLGILAGAIAWTVWAIPAYASIVPVSVRVDRLKADKSGWDVLLNAPDLAICIEGDFGVSCLPDGTSVETVKHPQCKDDFSCQFSARIQQKEFKVTVIDVDLVYNDLVGSGYCELGKRCDLGRATVEFGNPQGRGDRDGRNPSKGKSGFHFNWGVETERY